MTFYRFFLCSILATGCSFGQLNPAQLTAVELDGLDVATSEGGGWTVENDGNAVGGSALRSPFFVNGGSASVEIGIHGPDTVTFEWKMSGEEFSDIFTVSVNGSQEAMITGNTDWESVTLNLPARANTITWEFTKDEFSGAPDAAGMLDQIVIAILSPPRVIPPTGLIAYQNERFFLQLESFLEASSYTLAGTLPAGLTFDKQLGVISGIPSQLGTFPLDIWATGSAGVGPGTGFSLQVQAVSMNDPNSSGAVDFWRGDGDLPWTAGTDGGNAVIRSGAIADDERSDLVLPVYGPATLSYRVSVDSEDQQDFLRVSLDGALQQEFTGLVAWRTEQISIPKGLHHVTWSYQKDASDFVGMDEALIDDISVTGYSGYAFAQTGLLNLNPFADPDQDQAATIWEFFGDTNPMLASDRPPLSPVWDGSVVTLPIAPSSEAEGQLLLEAEESLDLKMWSAGATPVKNVMSGFYESNFPVTADPMRFLRYQLSFREVAQ